MQTDDKCKHELLEEIQVARLDGHIGCLHGGCVEVWDDGYVLVDCVVGKLDLTWFNFEVLDQLGDRLEESLEDREALAEVVA